MSVVDVFTAQDEVPQEVLRCGCSVSDTQSDDCLECPHLQEWMRLHGCEAMLEPQEDYAARVSPLIQLNKTRTRGPRIPVIPVSWRLQVFDKKPAGSKTERELATEIDCNINTILRARTRGHGLFRGWMLAGYLRPDKRSQGARKRWIWIRAGVQSIPSVPSPLTP